MEDFSWAEIFETIEAPVHKRKRTRHQPCQTSTSPSISPKEPNYPPPTCPPTSLPIRVPLPLYFLSGSGISFNCGFKQEVGKVDLQYSHREFPLLCSPPDIIIIISEILCGESEIPLTTACNWRAKEEFLEVEPQGTSTNSLRIDGDCFLDCRCGYKL